MKPNNMKNAAFAVLSIFLLGWLILVWAPMIRKDNEAFENANKAIRNSKSTIERLKSEIERIEKTNPQIRQVPDGNGMAL